MKICFKSSVSTCTSNFTTFQLKFIFPPIFYLRFLSAVKLKCDFSNIAWLSNLELNHRSENELWHLSLKVFLITPAVVFWLMQSNASIDLLYEVLRWNVPSLKWNMIKKFIKVIHLFHYQFQTIHSEIT